MKLNTNVIQNNLFTKPPQRHGPDNGITGKPPQCNNKPSILTGITVRAPQPGDRFFPKPSLPHFPNSVITGGPYKLPPSLRDGFFCGPIQRPPQSKVTRLPSDAILNCGFGLSDGFSTKPSAKRSF